MATLGERYRREAPSAWVGLARTDFRRRRLATSGRHWTRCRRFASWRALARSGRWSSRSARLDQTDRPPEIVDKMSEHFAARGVVGGSQDCRRVDRRHAGAPVRPMQELASLPRQDHRTPHQRKRGGRSERYDEMRRRGGDLTIEPPSARLDLAAVWRFVQPPSAARFALEMLHRICQVDRAAFDADLEQRAIQHHSGRSDKRPPGEVFFVARLFADHHQCRRRRSLAKNRPTGLPIERTARAVRRLAGDFRELLFHRPWPRREARHCGRRSLSQTRAEPFDLFPRRSRADISAHARPNAPARGHTTRRVLQFGGRQARERPRNRAPVGGVPATRRQGDRSIRERKFLTAR